MALLQVHSFIVRVDPGLSSSLCVVRILPGTSGPSCGSCHASGVSGCTLSEPSWLGVNLAGVFIVTKKLRRITSLAGQVFCLCVKD